MSTTPTLFAYLQ